MPNGKEHINAGKWFANITKNTKPPNTRTLRDELLEDMMADAAIPTLARLPDIIEPATSPHHRRTAHSLPAMLGAALLTPVGHKAADKLHQMGDVAKRNAQRASHWGAKATWNSLDVLSRVSAGVARHAAPQYALHLFLDSRTPKGLPWK